LRRPGILLPGGKNLPGSEKRGNPQIAVVAKYTIVASGVHRFTFKSTQCHAGRLVSGIMSHTIKRNHVPIISGILFRLMDFLHEGEF
jgi:hypothetical protein